MHTVYLKPMNPLFTFYQLVGLHARLDTCMVHFLEPCKGGTNVRSAFSAYILWLAMFIFDRS